MVVKIILFLVIFLNLLLGIFILAQNKKSLSNRLFALIGVLAAIWTFANYMTSISTSIIWLQSTYAFGSLVMSAGLIWILLLTENRLEKNRILFRV